MRKLWYAVASAALIAVAALPAAAVGAADRGEKVGHDKKAGPDNIMTGLAKKQYAGKQKALELKLAGKIAANAKVAKLGSGPKGQFVDLANEGSDRIFVVIAEFGNTRHPSYCDPGQTCAFPPDGSAQTYDGPLHNSIGEPDRTVDNTTIWQPDFDRAHYQDMYFNRMKKYYESQSSGRYTISGDVTEWVKVPFNEARYGRNACGGIVCSNTWRLVRDALSYWVQDQLSAKMAAGKTQAQAMAEITDYLKTFDKQDRYDVDGDGNFDEPDGIIDHFQIVHAGGDEAAGDPYQGTDAIWSHRWAAQIDPGSPLTPLGYPNAVNVGAGGLNGGVNIPNNPTNVWVFDYTVQPENGGLGVFAHEFGHDAFGLPDNYDTSGNTGGAENSTGFWDLMSSGANIGDGGDTIGDAPTNMTAWDKFQIGWLNYEVTSAGAKTTHKLTPLGANTKQAQGVFVVLPKNLNPSTTNLGTPTSPTHAWYSTAGDNLNVTMTHDVTIPAGTPVNLAMKAWYEIETCWDYAQLRVSTDSGATWTPLHTNVSDAGNENGQNPGEGITGISGSPKSCDDASGSPSWVDVTADLSAYAGQTIKLQVRYLTDGFVEGRGFEFDDLAITGPSGTILTADAEAGDTGWTLNGFRTTTGTETRFDNHYYLAEYRPYHDYDTSLMTAYNFAFFPGAPADWVETFPYQDGVVIWYWDTGQSNNNVGDHPGQGEILPVDIRPTFPHWNDGTLVRPRITSYDSALTLDPIQEITVRKEGSAITIPGGPAQPVFNDLNNYWFNCDAHACTGSHVGRYQPGWASVNVPHTGTSIMLKDISDNGFFANIQVAPAK